MAEKEQKRTLDYTRKTTLKSTYVGGLRWSWHSKAKNRENSKVSGGRRGGGKGADFLVTSAEGPLIKKKNKVLVVQV